MNCDELKRESMPHERKMWKQTGDNVNRQAEYAVGLNAKYRIA